MIDRNDFTRNSKFSKVFSDPRIDFEIVIEFFNQPRVQQRLVDSELHHDRPALAGVIKEFEAIPAIDRFLGGYDAHTTEGFRQAVGYLVKLHMLAHGWVKDGSKSGSLGKRGKTLAGTTTPGAYKNISGLSKWFTQAQRYTHPEGKEALLAAVVERATV